MNKSLREERGKEGYPNPKSLDNIAGSNEAPHLENTIKYMSTERDKEGYINEGSIDNIAGSDNATHLENTIKYMSAERAREGYINEGSIDNAAVLGNYDKNARERQLAESADAKKYFSELATNPTIKNIDEFKSAVSDSIKSNEVLNKFFDSYIENFSSAIVSSKGSKAQEDQNIDHKEVIENYLNVYSNLIHELKDQEANIDFNRIKFPDELKDDLISAQKSLCAPGEVFGMPIPTKLPGTDYQPMQLMGDAVSVINQINGYTPQGFIGRILGPNPDYIQEQNEPDTPEISE